MQVAGCRVQGAGCRGMEWENYIKVGRIFLMLEEC
jgi:hypothetical protein